MVGQLRLDVGCEARATKALEAQLLAAKGKAAAERARAVERRVAARATEPEGRAAAAAPRNLKKNKRAPFGPHRSAFALQRRA